jgi:tetratricopeptide (TPR) repeat protein
MGNDLAAGIPSRHRRGVRIGPYEVLNEIGRGGVGVVYRVRGLDGREAALKVLKADASTFARFERERRLLASLGEDHGFVGLLDAGVSAETAWLVMPLLPGGTLRTKLDAAALGVEETVDLGVQLAKALGAAHERGIVHRDVKPENILFTAEGRPLLGDLGLAKHFDPVARGGSQSVKLTQRGVFKGTAGYMAPEQIVDAATAAPQADVFALGAVLYECLAGRPAFQGETVLEVLTKLTSGVVEPIGRPGTAWLEEIVRRALAGDPRARFANGVALAQALGARTAPETRPSKVQPAPGRSTRSHALPWLASGIVAGAVALAGLLHVVGRPVLARPTSPTPPRAPPSARELVELARAKYKAGDVNGALADANRAIDLDPTLAQAWMLRGLARSKNGDLDGVIADETRAIELDPSLARAWMNRGVARGNKGDTDGEIADQTKALEHDPTLALAWANRALMRSYKADWDGAIADATNAVELDPTLAAAWEYRGAARGNKDDWDGDIADSTKAIELDPTSAPAWANRGIARRKKGDRDGAIADFEHALELDPTSRDAPQIRVQLEAAKRRSR